MASKSLFGTSSSALVDRPVDAINQAGGSAYAYGSEHALAQFLFTSCFNGAYYESGAEQLARFHELAACVTPEFLAKACIAARRDGLLKDAPAAGWAKLADMDIKLWDRIADRVVDSGKMILTAFQMVRSGAGTRKRCFSHAKQRVMSRLLNNASDDKLLSASVGKNPSLRDVLRLVRPTPPNNARRALYGWLCGNPVEKWRPATYDDLPLEIRLLDRFRGTTDPDEQVQLARQFAKTYIRWDLLVDAVKGEVYEGCGATRRLVRPSPVWAEIARNMGYQALRMNLNTLNRHGVFRDPRMVDEVASRLADMNEVRRSKQMPYQFFAAYLNASEEIPYCIRKALNDAAEVACEAVPKFPGPVVIGCDVSGSMLAPITGRRDKPGQSSKMRCIDVAALISAAILRKNPDSVVVPFSDWVRPFSADPGDQILSISTRLSRFGGGGTDCHLPVAHANEKLKDRAFCGVILISDNQSWVTPSVRMFHCVTALVHEWDKFVANQRRLGRFPRPKLICCDLQMGGSSQAPETAETLNIGGFSDVVFEVMAAHLADDSQRFVDMVKAVEI